MHSVEALHQVLGDALDGKHAQRELKRDPLGILKHVIFLLCTNEPDQYTVVEKEHAGETVIFDAEANIDVLLYAHRAIFFDPLLQTVTLLFGELPFPPGEDEIRTAIEHEGSLSFAEARAMLEKVAWLAPLVDHRVVELTNTGFAPAENLARDWRAPRLDSFSDIPIPIRGEYHWEQLRPQLVDAIGADPGRQLDEAWNRASHIQLRNLLESGGVFDPLFRSALEQSTFEFAIRHLGQVLPPNPDVALLQTLCSMRVRDLSRLTPSMMVEVREREEFERWRDDLGEALEALLKTDSVGSLRGRGIRAFERCLQARAKEIDQQSRRSKTIEALKGGVVGLMAGGIGIPAADAIRAANPANPLLETALTTAAGVGFYIAPLIRDWLHGRLRAQSALRNHYRAFITYE